MLVDELCLDENKKFTSLSEFNRHLESALPEVYMDDIYKYLRDCEVSINSVIVYQFSRVHSALLIVGTSSAKAALYAETVRYHAGYEVYPHRLAGRSCRRIQDSQRDSFPCCLFYRSIPFTHVRPSRQVAVGRHRRNVHRLVS